MTIDKEALAKARTAYRTAANYPIVPAGHDAALEAAITAYLAALPPTPDTVREALQRIVDGYEIETDRLIAYQAEVITKERKARKAAEAALASQPASTDEGSR